MKHIRGMVIVVLAAMTAGTWWNFVSDINNHNQAYHTSLLKAEQAEQEGLPEVAAEYYEQCLELKDSLEIQEKVFRNLRAIYEERGIYSDRKNLEQFLEAVKNQYYDRPEPYEWAADFYYEKEEWNAVIQIVREAQSLGLESEHLAEMWGEVAYKYETGYAAFEEIKELTEELYAAKDSAGWCYITRRGETYINGPYESATPMLNNRACVKRNGQVFMIDGEGKKQKILPEFVDQVNFVDSGWLPVVSGGKTCFYHLETGERMGEYEYAGRFKDGLAAVASEGTWKIIEENGAICSPSAYEDVVLSPTGSCYSDEYIIVKEGGTYHFLNRQFEPAMDFTCENLDFCRESVFAFSREGKWGFADLQGGIRVQPMYEGAKSFSNGLAAVMMDGKWGFIDEKGRLVIGCVFDDAGYFNNLGYCMVKKGQAWNFIHILSWTES